MGPRTKELERADEIVEVLEVIENEANYSDLDDDTSLYEVEYIDEDNF